MFIDSVAVYTLCEGLLLNSNQVVHFTYCDAKLVIL